LTHLWDCALNEDKPSNKGSEFLRRGFPALSLRLRCRWWWTKHVDLKACPFGHSLLLIFRYSVAVYI
jgi:hypothetical protein